MKSKHIYIVGGGLAGLVTALHLLRNDFEVSIFERNEYPKHKVCGEYISNEVLPYLKSLGIDPQKLGAVAINNLQCSSVSGKSIITKLPLGGFGISRYTLDYELYKAVLAAGGNVLHEQVERLTFNKTFFEIETFSAKKFEADLVIGAYGKRSNLDIALSRKFIRQKSPWIAVKSHYKGHFPADLVGLHNFEGGYCGISCVENNTINVCYLATLASFQPYKDVEWFKEEVLRKNTFINDFLEQATPVFEKPLTISQISFDEKERVVDHILMCGDSASLIHPLCGNGMAMAIMGARILSECIIAHYEQDTTREELENSYAHQWSSLFRSRLQWGRRLQKVLIHPAGANYGISMLRHSPWLFKQLIKTTHGKPSAA